MDKFSKATGHKSIYINWLCLDTLNNKVSEKEAMKTTPHARVSKRIKHLGIYLTKEVKLLYIQNYETLMEEMEEDTNKWKEILYS